MNSDANRIAEQLRQIGQNPGMQRLLKITNDPELQRKLEKMRLDPETARRIEEAMEPLQSPETQEAIRKFLEEYGDENDKEDE